jgi:hypothetical protein
VAGEDGAHYVELGTVLADEEDLLVWDLVAGDREGFDVLEELAEHEFKLVG